MADNARPGNDRLEFPRYDWVYRCDLGLGGVTPGHRSTRYDGHTIPYQGTRSIRTGARWCSRAWLRRTDTGVRGPSMSRQTGISRMGMRIKGVVTGGVIAVVPDDEVETAARLAARLVTPRAHTDGVGVDEWSMALVREPQRTRIAVAFGHLTPDVRQHLRNELDVEWFVSFSERYVSGQVHTHDNFRVETPDGAHSTWRLGSIHHDHEAVPDRLVEAARAAKGRRRPNRSGTGRSPAALTGNNSYRPLEPDERHDADPAPDH